MKVEDVDWLVLHQANQRILDSAAERLKFPPSKVWRTERGCLVHGTVLGCSPCAGGRLCAQVQAAQGRPCACPAAGQSCLHSR